MGGETKSKKARVDCGDCEGKGNGDNEHCLSEFELLLLVPYPESISLLSNDLDDL